MRRKGNENFSSKKGMAYDGWEKKVIHFGDLKLFFLLLICFPHKLKGEEMEMLFIPQAALVWRVV